MRRYRPDAPRVGHMFTTGEVSWQVVDERLERDGEGPYLQLVAERDFGEIEDLPNHELEHAEANRDELPEPAQATFARAETAGLEVELVALEPGEAPDWPEAEAYIDALILDEIEDDLLEQCGVDPSNDPQESWLGTVKDRLRADLEAFRADVEGNHDEIEEWEFRDGRHLRLGRQLRGREQPRQRPRLALPAARCGRSPRRRLSASSQSSAPAVG